MVEQRSNAGAFWRIDLVGVVTFAVVLVGIGMNYPEIKSHEEMTKTALTDVTKTTEGFQADVGKFIERQDKRAEQQAQVDRDCPRHRHGKNGEIFYCGQPQETTEPLDPDPPAAIKKH